MLHCSAYPTGPCCQFPALSKPILIVDIVVSGNPTCCPPVIGLTSRVVVCTSCCDFSFEGESGRLHYSNIAPLNFVNHFVWTRWFISHLTWEAPHVGKDVASIVVRFPTLLDQESSPARLYNCTWLLHRHHRDLPSILPPSMSPRCLPWHPLIWSHWLRCKKTPAYSKHARAFLGSPVAHEVRFRNTYPRGRFTQNSPWKFMHMSGWLLKVYTDPILHLEAQELRGYITPDHSHWVQITHKSIIFSADIADNWLQKKCTR